MLLLDKSAVDLWRMLLSGKNILFPNERDNDDLIFHYRDNVYFVHGDGATVRMRKPENLQRLTQEDLWERLFYEKETFDYEEQGMFSVGSILLDMGFLVPLNRQSDFLNSNYQVEVVNLAEPDKAAEVYQLERIPFRYALYHALLACHQLNENSNDDADYEIQQIIRMEGTSIENRQTPS